MSEDGKGETSTQSILFLAGAIGIGIWFLTVASDFVDSGTSPVYAIFFFVPICGVLLWKKKMNLVVVVLAEVMKSLSGSSKHNSELSGENTSSETSERERKNDISIGQFLGILAIVCVILFVMFLGLL